MTTENALSAPSFSHFAAAPSSKTVLFNTRRKSDFSVLNCTRYNENNKPMPMTAANAINAATSIASLQRTASDRHYAMPASLTSPSIASTAVNGGTSATATAVLAMASKRRRCSRLVNFGYACAIYYLDEPGDLDDDAEEEEEADGEAYEEEGEEDIGISAAYHQQHIDGPVTDNVKLIDADSRRNTEKIAENRTFGRQSCSFQESDYTAQTRSDNQLNETAAHAGAGELFLLRHRNEEIPHYCIRPQGIEADRFIQQSLLERNRSEIKKFLERTSAPEDGDWSYLWISQDLQLENCPVFIFSIKMLENFFKNERVRRVKWRHLSVDRISVYRYSLPQITTKFRLRIANFLVRHYRCCILCVWLLIILCISVGIIFSVMFGSAPTSSSKMNITYVQHDASQHEHRSGFMDDDIVGDHQIGIGGEESYKSQPKQRHHQQQQQRHLENQKMLLITRRR